MSGLFVCRSSDPQWLEERSRCVTGSELPAVMGKSRYAARADVLLEKVSGAGLPVTKNMWWGSEMEVPNMRAFAKLSGLLVMPDNAFWRDGVVGATIDGYVESLPPEPIPCWDDEYAEFGRTIHAAYMGKRGLIEMKNVSQFALKEWRVGCPEYYELQAQAQLLVTGLDFCVVVAKIGSADMVPWLVTPDADLHINMRLAAADFWKDVEDARHRR